MLGITTVVSKSAEMKVVLFAVQLVAVMAIDTIEQPSCGNSSDWMNMTMEEILFESDVVVWGRDILHAKLRHPGATDSRFEVKCVLKSGKRRVPEEIIIESIDEDIRCSPVTFQTEVGKDYILGLTVQTSGFLRYASINELQVTYLQHFKK